MPAPSELIVYEATATTRLDARRTNTTGSAIASLRVIDPSRLIADNYRLVLSNQSSTHADVTVTTSTSGSGLNPYDGPSAGVHTGRVFAAVVFDGSENTTLIPGLGLTLYSGTPANGWTTDVNAGVYAGLLQAGNLAGQQQQWTSGIANPGLVSVSPGQPQFVGKFIAKNVSAEAFANCQIVLYPRIKVVNVTAPIGLFDVYAIDATPTERIGTSSQVVPIRMTFANYAAGSPATIDALLNEGSGASTFDVVDVDVGGSPTTSTTLKADGTTRYQVREGGSHVENGIFTIPTTARNTSEENLLVWNRRHVWIAPDAGGSPGTWTQTSAVVLTQSGQASGVIQPSGAALFWAKWDVGALAALRQSPFPGDLTVEYSRTGEALFYGAP